MCLTTSHGFLCKSVPKVERYTFGTLVVHSCVSALWRRRLRVLGTDRCQPARAWSLWHVGVGRGDAQRRTIGSETTEGKSGHLHFEWPLGLVSVHRAPERERQSSLPSYHAARRALRGLEKNTTPSPSSPSKLKGQEEERESGHQKSGHRRCNRRLRDTEYTECPSGHRPSQWTGPCGCTAVALSACPRRLPPVVRLPPGPARAPALAVPATAAAGPVAPAAISTMAARLAAAAAGLVTTVAAWLATVAAAAAARPAVAAARTCLRFAAAAAARTPEHRTGQ